MSKPPGAVDIKDAAQQVAEIQSHTYLRMRHVTGPGCVLVSLRFGIEPDQGPWVTRRGAIDAGVELAYDVDAYLEEVRAGLKEANLRFGAAVQIEEIELVPDDFPSKGQVKHCAYKIAEHFILAKRE